MAVSQKIKDNWVRFQDFFRQMPKKNKIILFGGGAGILIFAVALTVFLNTQATAYQVIFPGMSTEESTAVYRSLLAMNASPKLSDKGEVMVPSEEYNIWLLTLVDEGYPRSTLTYDIYTAYSGITATETDRKRGDVFLLQDRIQDTLMTMSGVTNAIVTITVPQTSDYVWQQAESDEHATASVLLTLKDDMAFSPGQVTTVKSLVARAVPKMSPDDVTVVDSKSNLEMDGEAAEEEGGLAYARSGELEQLAQKQLEDNVVRLLESRYGRGGVVASAKVTLDFDKMMTEQMDLIERPPNEDGTGGGGYLDTSEGYYSTDGTTPIEGIVGEADNTDIPGYGYNAAADAEDATNYGWRTELEYGYVKTQIEKGAAPITRATISVMVDEANMTQARREELTNLIANSADIPDLQLISVSAFQPEPEVDETQQPVEPQQTLWQILTSQPLWVYLAAGVILLLIIAAVVIIVILRKRKLKKLLAAQALAAEEEAALMTAQNEIDDYKKQLATAATDNAKEDAILGEVRDFAKENPEITASLLRSWLREGD